MAKFLVVFNYQGFCPCSDCTDSDDVSDNLAEHIPLEKLSFSSEETNEACNSKAAWDWARGEIRDDWDGVKTVGSVSLIEGEEEVDLPAPFGASIVERTGINLERGSWRKR